MISLKDLPVIASAFFEIDDATRINLIETSEWVPDMTWRVPILPDFTQFFNSVEEAHELPGIDVEYVQASVEFQGWFFGYGPLTNTLLIINMVPF